MLLSDEDRAREYLGRLTYWSVLREVLRSRREELRAKAAGVGVDYSGVKAGKSSRRTESSTEKLAVELAHLDSELEKLMYRSAKLERELLELIETLDERPKVVILMRFVEGTGIEAIAEKLHYSSRQVQRICNDGVRALVPAILKILGREARED